MQRKFQSVSEKVIVVYLSAFLYPLQIKEELSMPGQLNLRQMGTLLPALPAWILVTISFAVLENGLPSLAILITVTTTILFALIAIALIYSDSFGKKVIDKLVTSGFV